MIDGIKIGFRNRNFHSILDSLGIKVFFIDKKNPKAIRKCYKYRHLIITTFHNGHVEVRGSLHKYHKGENHSDFNYNELCEAVDKLCSEFRLDPHVTKLQTLEFGVNVSPPLRAENFCSRLLSYKNDPFECIGTGYAAKNIGFQCVNQQYVVKLYDKGREDSSIKGLNILRFEMKARKMLFVKKAQIITLSDLKNQESLLVLADILGKAYRNILLLEDVHISRLNRTQKRDYAICVDTRSWNDIECRKRYGFRKRFNEIMDGYAMTNYKKSVNNIIKEKALYLIFGNYGLCSNGEKTAASNAHGEFNPLDKRIKYP